MTFPPTATRANHCFLLVFARRSRELAGADESSRAVISRATLGTKHSEGQMTQLRNLAIAGLAALAIGSAASAALADESGSFENRLSAASIGLPLGALPPAGLYTGLETAYLGMPNVAPSSGTFIPGGVRLSLPAIANAV